LVSEILGQPVRFPLGVHSYSLDEAQVAALRRQGVVVSRGLEEELFLLMTQTGSNGSAEETLPEMPATDPAAVI
jgi:hypothetical protein